MRIFIFHYHLNPGGVTRIIESQVAGFKAMYPELELNVVAGYCENEEYYKALNANLIINQKLNYLVDKEFEKGELSGLYSELYEWLKSLIKADDILHVHNLNLGKNPVLTLVFSQLNSEGYLLMNHAHDFAEDRPVNMQYMQKVIADEFKKDLQNVMYPKTDNYLVGVLNNPDYKRILELGVDESKVFLFPNPVYIELDEEPDKKRNSATIHQLFNIPAQKKIIVYPVRVIRRKNIGELILLATIFEESCQFLVTMAPRNPIEIEYYNEWLEFCARYDLPVIFEAGTKANFIELLSGADYCITTSIQEGFGMTFLEPWLVETPVIGRNLPYVTEDIKNEGVLLNGLYNSLNVPFMDSVVDFKELSFQNQRQVIRALLKDAELINDIIDNNEVLEHFPPKLGTYEIAQNKKTITQNFSINTYAKRIFESYKTILG